MNFFLFVLFLAALTAGVVYLDNRKEKQLVIFRENLCHNSMVRFYIGNEDFIGRVLTVIDNHALVQDRIGECYTISVSDIYPR